MTARIIDGKAIAKDVRAELIPRVQALGKRGITPGLAFVLVGERPASVTYVKGKARDCAEVGIESETIRLPENTTQQQVIELVQRLNADDVWHGVLVQLPLPDHMDEEAVIATVDPAKDVDGIGAAYGAGGILVKSR